MTMNPDDLVNADGWRPEPGDTVIGTVTDVSQGWSDWGQDYYPIVTVQPAEGEAVAVHCFHAVLRSRMVSIRPQVGDVIGVKYVGKTKSKDGKRDVTNYVVRRQGGPAGDPWANFAQAPQPTQAAQPSVPEPADEDIPF